MAVELLSKLLVCKAVRVVLIIQSGRPAARGMRTWKTLEELAVKIEQEQRHLRPRGALSPGAKEVEKTKPRVSSYSYKRITSQGTQGVWLWRAKGQRGLRRN